MPHITEAGFEAQLEELNERLRDCLRRGPSEEAEAAREILRELIAGYQLELSALRRHRGVAPQASHFALPPAIVRAGARMTR